MSNKVDTDSCWENLANAIIIQAAADYEKIVRRQKRHPDHTTLSVEQISLEKFFKSNWFKALCNLDGRALMQKIRTEVRA